MRGNNNQIRSRQNGFTIIEILAVLVVIGILMALVFTTYASIARNERNKTRQQDIQNIYQQLEAYYVNKTEYPTLADMNNTSWLNKNMPGLQMQWLRDPLSNSYKFTAVPQADRFSYAVRAADGASCDNKTLICSHYVLTATLEHATPDQYIKDSLN